MSAQQSINQLPTAGPITGSESVPIVQNGVTVQTTTGAITASPSQTQTFLTVNQEPNLPNSRYFSTGTGLSITDGGSQSYYRLNLSGISGSLETASTGLIVKDTGSTVVARSINISGSGLSISNADGVSGNPTLELSGLAQSIAGLSGTGILALNSTGTAIAGRSITGTSDQISVADGNGASANPTIAIADNPILPGTGAVTVPVGTNAQQPLGSNGQIRYNSSLLAYEGYNNGSWAIFNTIGGGVVTNFSAGSTGLTPSSSTTGSITLGGTLNVANGGTGTSTPALVAGTNVSITGTWPNQTINSSSSGTVSSVSVVTANGLSGTVANATTTPAITLSTSITGLLKGNGTAISAAVSGTDYAPATSGTSILYGNNVGGFSNVTIGSGISFASGTLSATGSGGTVTSVAATVPAFLSVSGSPITTSGTLSISYSGTALPLLNGGTGATTAATARSNLSAAQSGANTDITSVTLTTGTITTAPSSSNDIVNKSYADSIATGINFHAACNYATAAALSAYTYNNGASGVGATITAVAVGALTIDGYTFTSGDVGKRILIKNETGAYVSNVLPSAAFNGVYTLTQEGTGSLPYILTRATDYDTSGTGTNEIDAGDLLLVLSGTQNANTSWVQQTLLPITVGTTSITFIQFAAVQTYTAGTGLSLISNQFSIANIGTAGTYGSATQVPILVTNAQGQVTGVTNTSIALTASQITSGQLAIANGGTGQATASAAFNALSPITTTGDLIIGNGTNSATRIGIGTNGYVLTSNGTTASWSAATGGVTQIVAGTNVTISPVGGTGAVTINASGGGGSSAYTRTSFAATAGQTVFTVTYAVGYLQVYVNGVLLATSDYTATSGTGFTLGIACAVGDIVEALVITTSVTGVTTGKSIAMSMIFGY